MSFNQMNFTTFGFNTDKTVISKSVNVQCPRILVGYHVQISSHICIRLWMYSAVYIEFISAKKETQTLK